MKKTPPEANLPRARASLPLVYSCSGCSSAAQMANHLALELDRRGVAEMSCIAGVGGDVPALLRVARSGRPIIVLDGCPLQCAKSCLARHGIEPSIHHTLSDYGVKKRQHQDFELDTANEVLTRIHAGLDEPAARESEPEPENVLFERG